MSPFTGRPRWRPRAPANKPSAELSGQFAGEALQPRSRFRKLDQCCFVVIAIYSRRASLQFGVDDPPNGQCGLLVAQCVFSRKTTP